MVTNLEVQSLSCAGVEVEEAELGFLSGKCDVGGGHFQSKQNQLLREAG